MAKQIHKKTVDGFYWSHLYRFGQVHFHWGDAASRGSEHTVDGAAFALEMHLVHFKAELEDISAAVAEGKQDSLAVLGFLFQVFPIISKQFLWLIWIEQANI